MVKHKPFAGPSKVLFACGIGIGIGISGAACAQSSVTLYGIVDSGVTYVTHSVTPQGSSGTQVALGTGNRLNSRWGFTGKEDLGNGLRAIFTLESGMAMNTGALQQGGRLFGRQAFVGLDSDRYGTMMLGRQMTPMYRYFLALDPLGYSSYGFSAQDAQFVGRADNSVTYLGHVGPFELNALYSFGYDALTYNVPVAGSFRVGKQYDIGGRYVQGPLNLTFVYEQREGSAIASSGDSERRYVAGGSYEIGKATMYGGYELLLNNVQSTLAASPPQSMAYAGVRYRVTPAFDLAAATYYHAYRHVDAHALSTGVNADYWLSKRTALYTDITYVINSSKAALSATGWATSVATTTVKPGANQLAVAVGVLHKF